METTADLSNHEGGGADENDENVLISRKTYQVSLELMLYFHLFLRLASLTTFVSLRRDRWRC